MLATAESVKSVQRFSGHLLVIKRWKNRPNHWSTLQKKTLPIHKALDHFDDLYGSVYSDKWPSMRVALLSPHKYCAVVNNFSDTSRITSDLESEGAINLRSILEREEVKLSNKRRYLERKLDLNKIYKLDKKLEDMMKHKEQQELSALYPEDNQKQLPEEETKEEPETDTQQQNKVEHSLQSKLLTAEIDYSRQIDSSAGLNSASVHEFVPSTKLKGREDFLPESKHFSYYDSADDFPVDIVPENKLNFPQHLQVYTFENGNITEFRPPASGSTGVLDYYLMDGSSLFPVLALNLSPRDTLLDMCGAPGGKSLLAMQTLYTDNIVCNDLKVSRINRIKRVMDQFFYDWEKRIKITQRDGCYIQDENTFSKILVDVPCTTDRHSVMENDNNIFKVTRIKERIRLPEIQTQLLYTALRLVKVGGTVVYSTCSLSPIQNDGVVHTALRKIWEETSIKIIVKDLSRALEPGKYMFRFGDPGTLKYGHIVLPYLPANFGPMYFCKLVRTQ